MSRRWSSSRPPRSVGRRRVLARQVEGWAGRSRPSSASRASCGTGRRGSPAGELWWLEPDGRREVGLFASLGAPTHAVWSSGPSRNAEDQSGSQASPAPVRCAVRRANDVRCQRTQPLLGEDLRLRVLARSGRSRRSGDRGRRPRAGASRRRPRRGRGTTRGPCVVASDRRARRPRRAGCPSASRSNGSMACPRSAQITSPGCVSRPAARTDVDVRGQLQETVTSEAWTEAHPKLLMREPIDKITVAHISRAT